MFPIGGALGLSGLLYYLKRVKPRKKEEDVAVLRSSKEESFINPATATKEEVHGILLRVIESQDEMKSVMKNLIQMILANDYTYVCSIKYLDDELDLIFFIF